MRTDNARRGPRGTRLFVYSYPQTGAAAHAQVRVRNGGKMPQFMLPAPLLSWDSVQGPSALLVPLEYPDFVPGLPHVMLLELRQALDFVPG